MSSLLTITNKALRKLGVPEIDSLTQQGKVADRCNAAVRDIVREVLREHPWSFATEWATLGRKADPPFGYDYSYQIPTNAVRVIDVRAETDLRATKIDFELVRGGLIYTDATPCYARYTVYNESDLTIAPPDFIEACAWRLAEEVSVPLAKSDLMSPMHNGYLLALDRARLNDAATRKEREVDPNRSNSFLAARGYPHTEEDDLWP